jgi:hypothetical protein
MAESKQDPALSLSIEQLSSEVRTIKHALSNSQGYVRALIYRQLERIMIALGIDDEENFAALAYMGEDASASDKLVEPPEMRLRAIELRIQSILHMAPKDKLWTERVIRARSAGSRETEARTNKLMEHIKALSQWLETGKPVA